MLVAILMLYFYSNPRTFDILTLTEIGQLRDSPFHQTILWGKSVSWWAFLLLLVGFIIKLPSVPSHTWLPDAHVEAPTPISMILAGVLLKMGGYGVIRICYPICPDAGYELAWLVCGLGTVSMVYGALAALAQKDFKRLVAYSSVSHMGYVLLGIGVWSATIGFDYKSEYWTMAMSGAVFQMIAHGISSAGMFFLVGVVYERVHHRDIDKMGGLFLRMPVYSGISMGIFFAALGLPGLCGFIGEFLVVMGAWAYSKTLAVVAASVVILTAGYILWTIQRVYLGSEYKGPHSDSITPMTRREIAIAAPLLAFAILFGVYPKAVLDYVTPSVTKLTAQLTDWTHNLENAPPPQRRSPESREFRRFSQSCCQRHRRCGRVAFGVSRGVGDLRHDRRGAADEGSRAALEIQRLLHNGAGAAGRELPGLSLDLGLVGAVLYGSEEFRPPRRFSRAHWSPIALRSSCAVCSCCSPSFSSPSRKSRASPTRKI